MTKPLSRWGAFALHLLGSVAIFAVLASLVLFWFFPGDLFLVAGGWEGLRIIIAVDLVLGPCLTLIVFNPRKPRLELVRDLSLITMVQILALVGGGYVVANARPLAVVHVFDTLYVFNREDYRQLGVEPQTLEEISGWAPKFFYVEVPVSTGEFLTQHVKALLNGEKPLQQRVDLYQGMPSDPQELANILRDATPNGAGNCVRVDIESSYRTGSVCIDPVKQRISDFIPAI